MTIQAIKPGTKRIAISTGKPDQRQRDNKGTPSNTPSLKPSKSTTKKQNQQTTTKSYLAYIILTTSKIKIKQLKN